jgi:RHS repeat-associated protein
VKKAQTPVGRLTARVLIFAMALQGVPLSQVARASASPMPIASVAGGAATAAASVFGPRDYVRDTGQPVGVVDTFAADPAADYTLRITNGGLLGQYERVSSAEIHLNGVLIAGPSAFGQQVHVITIPVSLAESNTLRVELRSQPSSGITIEISGGDAVNRAPTANAGPDQSAAVGAAVTLDGSASSDPDGDALSYDWSLITRPAGSAATLSNPTAVNPGFVADRSGTYVARLIVNDGQDDSAPDTVSITVANTPPAANAGPDQSAAVGAHITLDGSASSDADGDALTYDWLFVSIPAGSTAVLVDSASISPTFDLDEPGSYVVRLVVHDGQAESAPDTVTITTTNSAPVANAGPDQTTTVGTTVTLDGSASSDADGDPLQFNWTLTTRPAGSGAALVNPASMSPTLLIDSPGTYVARLIVSDGFASSVADFVTITTTNSAPVANAGPDRTVLVGATVALDGTHSSDVDGDSLTFRWSLSSRPAGSTAALSDPFAVTPSFVVDLPGAYVAQLIVNDGSVDSAPDTVTVTTTNSVPVANAGADRTVPVGTTQTLDGSLSTDADGDPLTFSWALTSRPAGSTTVLQNATSVSPSFIVDLPGMYVVQLIVNDGIADSAPDTAMISTINSAPVANAGADQTAAVSSTVTLDGSGSSDVDGDVLTFSWALISQPPGSAAALVNPASVSPQLTPDRPGSYVVQLIVNDGTVDSAPDTVVISTTNSAPVANAGPDQTAFVGNLVTLDGSGSTDIDGDALTFAWAITTRPVGSTATLSDPSAMSPAFSIDAPGTYVVQLIVNDGAIDSAPDTVMISTLNSRPVANAGADQTVLASDTVTLDGSASSDADGDALTYQWAIIARPAGSAAVLSDPGAAQPSFVADHGGDYVIQLIINDGTDDSAPDTVSVVARVTVPNVVGSLEADASAAIAAAQLALGALTSRHDDTVPAGRVITQTPAAGVIVNAGTLVDLEISLGPAPVAIPPVAGLLQADAETALTGVGLAVGAITTEHHDTVAAGRVIRSAPVEGTMVPFGSAVDLVVSLGPTPVEVPDVAGLTLAEAQAALAAAGFVVGPTVNEASNTVPPGSVIRLIPAIGTAVPPGSTITIVVSSGPAAPVLTSITLAPLNPSLARGLNQQFVATGHFSDGHSEDLTTMAAWSSDDTAVAPIDPISGIAAAVNPGTTIIRATSGGITGTTNITVTEAPIGSIVVTPPNPSVLTGQSITFSATAVLEDGTSESLAGQAAWVSSDPAVMSIDPVTGVAQALAAGPTVVSASRDGVIGTTNVAVSPAVVEGTLPSAAITSPTNNALVTAPINITGTANDANFLKYELDYAIVGQSIFVPIATGTSAVVGGTLGTLDPTAMINDLYTLRLRVFDRGGNITTATIVVQVTKDMKIGLFTLMFEDVTIPMAGLPLSVIRLYDSRDKSVGDFGVGWRIDLRSVRVRANRVQGTGWQANRSGGFFPVYSIVGSDQHKISVTLPTGKVEEFDMTLTPNQQTLIPLDFTTASYTPRPGSLGTLRALGDNELFIEGAQPGAVTLITLSDFEPYDPQVFEYTTADGAVIVLHKTLGVQSMRDLNGNTLTFGAGGITHSAGRSVVYQRDGQGRITRITDPNGNAHVYTYDQNGDLSSHRDPLDNVTRYFYNLSHGLIEVRDPRGIHPTKNEYDESGRLIATVDPAGNRTEYTHNTGVRQEVVRDRRGNNTVYDYDAQGNVLSKTNALGDTVTFTYDARGNELTRRDELGNLWQKTFDARDNPLTETDPLGRVITRTFNARRQVLSETDRLGRVSTSVYDANGNQTSVTNPTGTTGFTYDPRGNRLSTTNAMSQTTQFTYDSSGRRATQTDPLGIVTSYTNDANGNRLTDTVTVNVPGSPPVVQVMRREYDARNRLIADIDAAGGATRFEFNSLGKESALIDKNGNRITFEYDANGRKSRALFPDGFFELMGYDEEGNMTRWTDRSGRVTTYTFDALNRLTRTTLPDGTFTSTEYDQAGKILAAIDERGNRTEHEYNAAGHKIRTTDAAGNVTTYVPNANGKNTSMTDALGHTTTYQYDALDRLTRTTFHDGSFTTTAYDAAGRKTQETDQLGQSTAFTYDAAGRLTRVTDAAGGQTSFTYDEAGNRLTQTDANGNTTRWAYDAAGRVIRRTLPLGMSESATWDAMGNQLSRTDFRGRTTTFQYDVNNRLILTTYPDSSVQTFTYTPTGKRLSATDARGTTTYAYDLRDRVTRVTHPDGAEVTYSYDGKGNVLSVGSPAGTTVSTYDNLNRLATVTDASGGVTTYTYDAVGNRAGVTHPNATRTSYTYDTVNRLTALEHRSPADAVMAGYAYALDAKGRRTSLTESSGRTVTYTYDGLSRLLSETIVDAVAGNKSLAYTYDAVGNRLTRTEDGNTTNYGYDINDRLLSEGLGIAYAYDDNGNQIRKNAGPLTDHYDYDFENRLISVDSGTDTTYGYDVDGARVRSTVGGATTTFLVDANRPLPQVLEERGAGGALVAAYTFGDDLIRQVRGGIASYYHFDGTASTRLLSDAAGAATDAYAYDAFGRELAATGATENRYRFNGQSLDAETSFYYLRARYFGPSMGRFLTMDPLQGNEFDPPSLHKYAYANNDPVNSSDPTGRFTMTMTISISFPTIALPTISLASILAVVKTVALAIAATCGVSLALSTMTSFQGPDPCNVRGQANMFYPGGDTPVTTAHIATAIASGYPARLNRISPGHSRSWLRSTPQCSGNVAALTGLWCDEYPFASSRQGGPGSSVMLAPRFEQLLQGGKLSAFYALCKVTPNVPPDDGYAVGPAPFLPTTLWVCKN